MGKLHGRSIASVASRASILAQFCFSRQVIPFSLSCFIIPSLSYPPALFQSHSFSSHLYLLLTITNCPYLSLFTFLFVTCLLRLSPPIPRSQSGFFASDVSVSITKCLQSFLPPASCTCFSHHQCIRCCGQHYQQQHLCHRNHRGVLKSVSVPPSTCDVAFYSCR